jgi:uncharacterized membrane protein (UPF0127 family)
MLYRLFRPATAPVLAIGVVLTISLAACQPDRSAPPDEKPPFDPEGVVAFERPDGSRIAAVAAEFAEGDSAQERGLMGRRNLPERGGMFFPYEDAQVRRFWMKNTYLPLDIVFVGPDSQIVKIARDTKPLSTERISSGRPAQYVVEVRAGFTGRHGLDTTIRIDWRRSAQ